MGPFYDYFRIAMISCLLPYTLSQQRRDCSRNEYNRCVSLADPLLKEAHLVFPDNMQDIELVCLTWNQFVDCLKSYTERCFTPQQRRQFNKAVENPIESVHQMCTQRNYQQEYLQHASCIKSTVTMRQHCGDQYTQLVQQVQQGDAISRASLCCTHDRFKRCVMKEARKLCDRGQNGQAVRFAGQIIDKALSFLQDQCYNYIPNSGDCSTQRRSQDDIMTMSSVTWTNRASTRSNDRNVDLATLSTGVSPLEVSVSNPDQKVTDVGWLPSVREDEPNWRKEPVTREPTTIDAQGQGLGQGGLLGSRTRPSSYGRSNAWDTVAPTTTSNWATPTPPETSGRHDWATMSTWNYQNTQNTKNTDATDRKQTNEYETTKQTTETWYPAAGSHVGNEVDEPNQLGLSKPKNSAALATMPALLMLISTFYTIC